MANPFRKDPIVGSSVPAVSAAFSTPRALTSAATRIKLEDKAEAEQFRSRSNSSTRVWQSEAWEYYDAIGEIKYAFTLVASVVSRIRLYAATVEDPAEAPIPVRNSVVISPDLSDAAERALARLDSAYGGQAGLLRDAALNLSVAGECFLVQVPDRLDPDRPGVVIPESWDIRSVDELRAEKDGSWVITPRRELLNVKGRDAEKQGVIFLKPNAFVGRLWRAHPRYSEEPDSSLRGLLDLCSELLLLNRTFRATARSRLNSGAMYLPDGLSTAGNPDPDLFRDEDDPAPTPEELNDEFENSFMEAMITPIEDESSAAAVVPLLIRGPAELGEKIKQFKFERAFDASLIQRGDRVLERILQGLDVPKDTVTGLANVKYSNAVQIDESLYKAHIEPMLLLISDAITVVFLRPYLLSQGWDPAEVARLVVWYDPSSVATRNDRAADADSGFEKGAISLEAWRRAHGFSEADAPTPNETILRMLQANGTFSPELSESLMKVIAPELMEAARAASQSANVAPIPGNVSDVLSGGDGVTPADPAAPDAAAPTEGLAEPETEVPPGEDAPPFPLAEPQ